MLLSLSISTAIPSIAYAWDESPAPILQWFEGSYKTMENRMPDVFKTGYGSIYTPPTGRADQGNLSVGYDPYDRFDLGSAGNPTLYGTETGLRQTIATTHRAGVSFTVDLVWNHNGYSTTATTGFVAAGGYPGMAVTLPNAVDGDFHSGYATGDLNGRVAGLIDIDHSTNFQFIRNPVGPNPLNIPAGTTSAYGRLANVPDANNARFYPDKSLTPIVVYDPKTGEANIPVYPFNNANPMAGDAIPENALGYLMRNAQWLIQSVGVDNFRFDAAKHVDGFVLNYLDRAVYRANPRLRLDGSRQDVFTFQENYDGNKGYLQGFVRKDIDPNNPGVIGGNRDVLDFPLFFALRDNLTGNGLQNSWYNVQNATFDYNDDNKHNGSQGVMFVSSHDNDGPTLGNVAYAYTLMHPGNSIVYYNGKEFGTNRAFPKDGRGDALGGQYGNSIQKLVEIRNAYGCGNYIERYIQKEILSYERQGSAIVLLSNRTDPGYDTRTLQTSFAPGTYLEELTGNASSSAVDPLGDIADVVQVNPSGQLVDIHFVRNSSWDAPYDGVHSHFTGNGYLVYGLPAPRGTMSLTNVASTLAGSNGTPATNGTTRVEDISVITSNSFSVNLNTNKVSLAYNGGTVFDHDADGDNALLKIDDGFDANNSGTVDYRSQGVVYGFEEFTTTHTPGYTSVSNNGTYSQSIDATKLSEGYHFITARAFRHRSDGGPPIYKDFKQSIYVDRLKPVSEVSSFLPWDAGNTENRDLIIKSTDSTANNVHVFLNLPANLTDAQILAMVGSGNNAGSYDRDLFKYGFFGVPSGNNVATIVTYEITGNVNVQRVPGISLTTTKGTGIGDLNYDNAYTSTDVANAVGCFEQYLYSKNDQFNPAGDSNGDGKIDTRDMFAIETLYQQHASSAVQTEMRNAVIRRGNMNGLAGTDASDIDFLCTKFGAAGDLWQYDLNVDGAVNQTDVDLMIHSVLHSEYGDANLDGRVNTSDFNVLAGNFGSGGQGFATGDFNGNGIVDSTDFNTFAQNYGFIHMAPAPIPGSSLGAIVPEPSSIGLLAVVLAGLARRRR